MKEPKYILQDGTKVITHVVLHPTTGMLIAADKLANRRANTPGTVVGVVGGHGGDVYWVRHEDGTVAAYGWPEMELEGGDPVERVKVFVFTYYVDTARMTQVFDTFQKALDALVKRGRLTDEKIRRERSRFEEHRVMRDGDNMVVEVEVE